MVKCNKERIKEFDSQFTITSDLKSTNDCEQDLVDADFLDFKTDMDNRSFYEKTAFNLCEDLIYVKNEEALWRTIVGEIKTPQGVLNNSIGQQSYGCSIWEFRGQILDSLTVKEIEYEIIRTCLRYPEINNVIHIESYIDDKEGALFVTLTLDTIYGSFDGHIAIPNAFRSDKNWQLADAKFFNKS